MKKKILFADDDLQIRRMASRLLGSLGCEVVAVEDGVKAIKEIETNYSAYGFVVTDLNMPGMDGIELVNQIRGYERERKLSSRIPIAILTGYANGREKEGTDAGCDHFLEKPGEIMKLRDITAQIYAS